MGDFLSAVGNAWSFVPWLNAALVIGLAASFTPQRWIDWTRKKMAGIELPGGGEKSPGETVDACLAALQTERAEIATAREKLNAREEKLLAAEKKLMLVKGGTP